MPGFSGVNPDFGLLGERPRICKRCGAVQRGAAGTGPLREALVGAWPFSEVLRVSR